MMDYSLTHRILLFRFRYLAIIDDENFLISNIDILLGGVTYMESHTELKNPIIRLANKKELIDVNNRFSLDSAKHTVFVISTRKNKNYLVASNITIMENYLDDYETSIGLKRKSEYPYKSLYEYPYWQDGICSDKISNESSILSFI